MASKVAVVKFDGNVSESFSQALRLIGGIDDLNTPEKNVIIKVGIFHPRSLHHTSVSVVEAIINGFNEAPKVFLAESDNYCGTGTERLQIWKKLFNNKVAPFNLSADTNTRKVKLANQEMNLSHVLFKPNVFVSTHVLRSYHKGSILKNLFGCTPTAKKAKYHKNEIFYPLLADVYEAVGGIDLAVLDATHLFHKPSNNNRFRMNTILMSRDAVAVETVGAVLAGLKPEKMQVIQEFVKRGLGEGDIEKIEIVGAPFESLKEKFAVVAKKLEKMAGPAPTTWAPEIDRLIREGFFKLPKKRTREDVAKALEAKEISTKGNMNVIVTTLNRRIKKGVLKGIREPDGWVYWTE